MAISESQLNIALGRAQALLSKDGQRRIERASSINKNGYDENGDLIIDESIKGMGANIQRSNPLTKDEIKNSKLPKAIAESLYNNPINSPSSINETGSILDNMNINSVNTINEEFVGNVSKRYDNQIQPSSQIDYNYIKYMIKEGIKEAMEDLKKEMISESSLRTIKVGKNNKIQLLDNNGNLFESTLSFKKNISHK